MHWAKDEDIMGDRRGAHVEGKDICPQYVFKKPGGVNPDGTVLWGELGTGRCPTLVRSAACCLPVPSYALVVHSLDGTVRRRME